jgi:hypothetical protein
MVYVLLSAMNSPVTKFPMRRHKRTTAAVKTGGEKWAFYGSGDLLRHPKSKCNFYSAAACSKTSQGSWTFAPSAAARGFDADSLSGTQSYAGFSGNYLFGTVTLDD